MLIADIFSKIVEKYPFLKDFDGKFVTYALLTTKNERYLLRLSFPFYVQFLTFFKQLLDV